MNIRKPLALLATGGAVVLAVFFYLLVDVPAQVEHRYQHGLLWELSRPGTGSSHLFGTLHSEDPEAVRLAAPVQQAFEASRAVVLEVLLDMEAMKSASLAMFMTDGRSLKSLAGEALFAEAAALMRRSGIPEIMTDRMHPWAVAVTLSLPPPETGQVLDMVLYRSALASAKTVHALETVEEQLDVFNTMALDDQLILLRDAVAQFPAIDDLQAQLLQAWKDRDLARLVEISELEMASGGKGFAEEFNARLIVDRNHLMAQRVQPYLEQGGAFVAVGALHLPGEQGLLNLLEQAGYTVSVVY